MSLTCATLVRVPQRYLTHCLGYLVEKAEMERMVHQARWKKWRTRSSWSTGVSAMDDVDNVREIIRLLAREELYNLSQQICNNDPVKVVVECALATEGTPTPTTVPNDTTLCPGATADNPADSCRAILDCNPSAPSGNYWIGNGSGVLPENSTSVYCYMEADKCGVGGVMRVALIDMRNTSVNCPAPLTQYQLNSGECVGPPTLHNRHVTLSSSPPTTSATNMCVGGLLGSPTTIHVHSGITSIVVRTPLTMLMCLDCQSHTGLRMGATIFGHMLEVFKRVNHTTATVPVQLIQEPAHRHLWGRTFTVNPPLATDLLRLKDGTPTTPSGMERTATLEAVAVTTLLLRGSGGHSRRRPQRT